MRRVLILPAVLSLCAAIACGGGGATAVQSNVSATGTLGDPGTPAATSSGSGAGQYVLLAWSELGMHCMDGKDYSVFSVLPPYNSIRAQLLKRGTTPQKMTSGVTLTYEAVADANGSINTYSYNKTNFWSFVRTLFHADVAPDVGIANFKVQSRTPQKMTFNAQAGYWEGEGIPTVPYDDSGTSNAYPMAKLVARDSSGNVLATAKIVLAVSDEMSCSKCHASNSNTAAKPLGGWENNSDPAKDVKLNILRLHDERVNAAPYLSALAANGYTYQAKLRDTALAGTPILCASCHATNALGLAGVSGVKPLTQDMHNKHANVVNPATGTTLNASTTPGGSCYLCHPGEKTKCQRGAMNKVACFDCHGNLSVVGAATRRGWLDLPNCQECHNNSQRYGSTFTSPGVYRSTTDTRFATTPNVPVANASLFRYSKGHGSLYCSSCHGSQHAELPSLQPNDNVYTVSMQGYAGHLRECTVCHSSSPSTATGGPHGMHPVGASWVSAHHDYAESNRTQCAYCHGKDYRGSPLSVTKVTRTFSIEGGTKTIQAGTQIGCYTCHNGPSGG